MTTNIDSKKPGERIDPTITGASVAFVMPRHLYHGWACEMRLTDEFESWCFENFTGEWAARAGVANFNEMYLELELEEDAILFQLTWLG